MADPSYDTLRFERHDHVGWLHLARPEKLNAFTAQMWQELGDLGRHVGDDADLRAVIVTGHGRAFSSGIDTSVFTEGTGASVLDDRSDRHADPTIAGILAVQDAFTWLEAARYPTIAAVRGYALGAGLQLAMACDLRVMGTGTKLGLLELQYGILPDLGGTQRLPRLVGPSKALQLIVTGADRRGRGGAHRARRRRRRRRRRRGHGACARRHDRRSAAARGARHEAGGARRRVGCSIADGLLVEAEAQAVCLRSADMAEAIAAFVEQRPPVYRGA